MRHSRLPLLLLFLGTILHAQDVRVHVLPTVNRTGEAQFEAVATTVTDTVALTLRLLARYRISEGTPTGFAGELPLPTSSSRRDALLAELAEAIPAENIVFGEVVSSVSGGAAPGAGGDPAAPGAGGDGANGEAATDAESGLGQPGVPELILSVYDRLEGRVVLTERRRPESLFDIFAATDEITAALLTSFSGRRVAFGSVLLQPTGGPADYTVLVDGNEVGKNRRRVESILTGAHQLVVTSDVGGERRELFRGEIMVEEGRATTVAFELPTPPPEPEIADAAEPDEAALAAAREEARKAEHAEAMERLLQEREMLDGAQFGLPGLTDSRFIYQNALDFYKPSPLRVTARENARIATGLAADAGRRLLADREYEAGVEAHRRVAEVGSAFGSPDLFGRAPEVSFVAENWAEYQVQRERKPLPVVPWIVYGLSLVLSADVGGYEDYREPGQLAAHLVPGLPLVVVGATATLWNATDWDFRPRRRDLRRYGRNGGLRMDRTGRRGLWELTAGANYMVGSQTYTVEPGSSGENLGVGAVSVRGGTLHPTIRGRYWFHERHAVDLDWRIIPVFGTREFTHLNANFDSQIEGEVREGEFSPFPIIRPTTLSVGWTHTRTGRATLRLGLSLTSQVIEYQDVEEQEVESYRELLGSKTTYSYSPGFVSELAFRFGRGPLPPWELNLGYQLDFLQISDGLLADQGPYAAQWARIGLARSLIFGGSRRPPVAESPSQELLSGQNGAAYRRWEPSPMSFFFDPGGFLTFGSRFGLELESSDRWSVAAYGRAPLGPVSLGGVRDGGEEVLTIFRHLWPGLAVRHYWPASDRFLDGRWYAGAVLEYAYLTLPDEFRDAEERVDTIIRRQGSFWAFMLEGGYRIPAWRRVQFEVGLQIGYALGEGYEYERYQVDEEGNERLVYNYGYGNQLWAYPVISLTTPLF